jgi:hypothetical protein
MQNIRKTYFGDRVSLIVCGFIAACVILLSLYFIVGYFAYRPYQKYLTAMKEGDGESAVYYATKLFRLKEKSYNQHMEKYGHASSARYEECYRNLSYAYELNGEYDIALERCHTIVQQNLKSGPDIARVLYRMGRHSESFEKYCEFYKEQAETYDDLEGYRKDGRKNSLYNDIMCHDIIYDSRKFRPFATFHDFYEFMKTEGKKSGKQYEYAKVMEFIRQTDSKADDFMADVERVLSDRSE